MDLKPNAKECLLQLFLHGPTWDGNIVSKAGRADLFQLNLATRTEGWTYLTVTGAQAALALQFDVEKDKRERQRRKAGVPVYHIAFDTMDMKTKIRAVRVEISEEFVDAEEFDDRQFNIGLADDKHYLALQRYVKGNPRRDR